MKWFSKTLILTTICGLMALTLASPTQTTQMSAPTPPKTAVPTQMASAQGPAHQQHSRVIVVEPIRVFDPFLDYPYPYTYPPDYLAENFGYVKIKTDRKDASVYVDGGFADQDRESEEVRASTRQPRYRGTRLR